MTRAREEDAVQRALAVTRTLQTLARRHARLRYPEPPQHAAPQQRGGELVEWHPLPEAAAPPAPVRWIGREGGEEVAWISEWRHWAGGGCRWQVATPHGRAAGLCQTLPEAQRLIEEVRRAHGMTAAGEQQRLATVDRE
jgi:hypothetical protein